MSFPFLSVSISAFLPAILYALISYLFFVKFCRGNLLSKTLPLPPGPIFHAAQTDAPQE